MHYILKIDNLPISGVAPKSILQQAYCTPYFQRIEGTCRISSHNEYYEIAHFRSCTEYTHNGHIVHPPESTNAL